MVSVSDCTTRLVLIDDEKHHFDTFTDCLLPSRPSAVQRFIHRSDCAVAHLFYLLVTLCLRVSGASLFHAQLCHYI